MTTTVAAHEQVILDAIDESPTGEITLAEILGLRVADMPVADDHHRALRAVKDAARVNAEAVERLIRKRKVQLWVIDVWAPPDCPPDGAVGRGLPTGLVNPDTGGLFPEGPMSMFAVPVLFRRVSKTGKRKDGEQ